MNKISSLLDDITVINFSMFWKLICRYRRMCIAISLSCTIVASLFYLLQSNIYSSSLSFKAARGDNQSTHSVIFTQADDKLKADIMRLERSVDFYRIVASRLLSQYSLSEIVQGINKNSSSVMEKIILTCSDNAECANEQLANLLPSTLDITYGDREGNNFILTVRTFRAQFNRKYLDVVIDAIHHSRIETRRQYLLEQQQITKQMINKNKGKLSSQNFDELSRKLGQIVSLEKEFDDKLKVSHQNLVGQMERFDAAKSQLDNRKQAKNREVKLDDVEISKRRRSLQSKVEQLTGDLNAVELMADGASVESGKILIELKMQLEQAKAELSKMPQESRGYDNLDKFISSNDEKIDASEFDFKVISDQVEMARNKYRSLQEEKQKLIDQRIKLETEMKQIGPTVTLLGDLESKNIEYQLLESTVVSDLVFDRFATSVKQMRKLSLFFLLLYTFISMFFLLLTSLVGRYLLDNRIYDEDDLKSVLGHVKILGSIPEF